MILSGVLQAAPDAVLENMIQLSSNLNFYSQ